MTLILVILTAAVMSAACALVNLAMLCLASADGVSPWPHFVTWLGYVGLAAIPFFGIIREWVIIVILFVFVFVAIFGHFFFIRAAWREVREQTAFLKEGASEPDEVTETSHQNV